MNPDLLRVNPDAISFVRDFFSAGKPVAAICHAPWLVVEAGAARGRRMTSYPSIRTDVTNAGATWIDESVVTDNGLVTSRSPKDLEDFNAKMLEEFAEGVHVRQHA
jgi:protease I